MRALPCVALQQNRVPTDSTTHTQKHAIEHYWLDDVSVSISHLHVPYLNAPFGLVDGTSLIRHQVRPVMPSLRQHKRVIDSFPAKQSDNSSADPVAILNSFRSGSHNLQSRRSSVAAVVVAVGCRCRTVPPEIFACSPHQLLSYIYIYIYIFVRGFPFHLSRSCCP